MRRKTFITSSFIMTVLSFAVFFTVTIFQYGCNGGNQQTAKSPLMGDQPGSIPVEDDWDWLSFGIKFNPNVNSEMRSVSFTAIENVVMDTIYKIRSGYPNFSPKFLIGKTPFGDTLEYEFRVEYSPKDTIVRADKPPCKCINNCGVCFMIKTNVARSKTDTSQILAPYRNISEIIFYPDK